MRVLLIADMEGVSWITDHRECWPCFPEYWRTGRRRMTADVVAAASGLLKGGASEVVVQNAHGLGGWPNLLSEELPERCEMLGDRPLDGGFDAHFQVGFHARCGTNDGFVSHTHVPDFRIEVAGRLVTECHFNAWSAGTPLLGITGDAALEPEIDGALEGTPFLAVKRSSSRTDTAPLHASPAESCEAIRAFARRCATGFSERSTAALPSRFTVRFSMNAQLAGAVGDESGLRRESPSVLAIGTGDWTGELRPAWLAAVGAAIEPLLEVTDGLDLSSEAALERQDPAALEHYRRFWYNWLKADFERWIP